MANTAFFFEVPQAIKVHFEGITVEAGAFTGGMADRCLRDSRDLYFLTLPHRQLCASFVVPKGVGEST